MPAQAVTRECAQAALKELERESKAAQVSQNIPFEWLDKTPVTGQVEQQWFESLSNRQRAAEKHKVEVQYIDRANLRRSGPIRYLSVSKPGFIQRPAPDTIMVIIALCRLTRSNGFPGPDALEQGQDLSLSGDDPQLFDGQGGGLAYLLMLKKPEKPQT
ncbi:hypothetical protein MMC17_009531 [Xylographa soralifera]|nr:hypothetical protein [Xylographa soralifera]